MALFTDAMFANDFDRPVGETGSPLHAGDGINLQLSDGTSHTIFDKLTTALKLAAFMRTSKQWSVAASEDVTIVSANGGLKLLLLENTLQNQKLLTSFVACYTGDELLFQHRSMSSVVSLTDALRTVGFCVKGLPYANNLDLRLAGTGIQVVDWQYAASVTDAQPGSKLSDGTPLVYDFTSG
jgi:hypothetical protein